MPEFTEYAPGTPSWVDLGTPDVAASEAFYSGLFGWARADLGPDAGGYGLFQLRGKTVAGVGPLMGEGQPPAWSTYIAVADADETARKVTEAGGTVVMPPMDVMDAGRMAVCFDPTGAAFSIWQAGTTKGADLANETGAFGWNELNTRDTEKAKAFYAAVFGWGADTQGEAPNQYTEWKLGGKSVGGMMDMTPNVPEQVPPHWLTYFQVDDCDASATTATELGGSVMVGPMDIEPGRFAVVSDPQGAWFAIIKMKQA